MTPRWLTAFLDHPADGHDRAVGFWEAVTGSHRSPRRGEHGEFLTLLPTEGDAYLKLQRVEDGEPRVHLDVHVDDPRAAAGECVGVGATLVADHRSYLVLTSPGGLTFCLVPHGSVGARPHPRAWPDGHTSYVDQVCLDIPPSRYDAEMEFWAAVTGWSRRDPATGSEFGRLTPGPDQPLQLLLQRLDEEQGAVSAHLDWSASDHKAEVDAHVAAGAEVQGRFEGWTVMSDPAGMTYCVTRRTPGDRPE